MSEQSENIGELALALSKAQSKIGGAKKDSSNPFFKSKYADLESVWDACREELTKNDLSVMQTNDVNSEGVVVVTTLAHGKSGQWVRGRLFLKPVKNDPQGIGSCITYGRRYALAGIVGVYQTDDDGNAASGKDDKPARASSAASVTPHEITATVVKVKAHADGGEQTVSAKLTHNGLNWIAESTTDPNMSKLLDSEGKTFRFLITDSGKAYSGPDAALKGKGIVTIHNILEVKQDNNDLVPILAASIEQAKARKQ